MSFIRNYEEEAIQPPREIAEIIDVEIVAERKLPKSESSAGQMPAVSEGTEKEAKVTEVFSKVPEDTVRETKPVKKQHIPGDQVSCLVASEDDSSFSPVGAKILRKCTLPDKEQGSIALYLLDTGSLIIVATVADDALAGMASAAAGLSKADLVAIKVEKYSPQLWSKNGFSKNWIIERLWKTVTRAKKMNGKGF